MLLSCCSPFCFVTNHTGTRVGQTHIDQRGSAELGTSDLLLPEYLGSVTVPLGDVYGALSIHDYPGGSPSPSTILLLTIRLLLMCSVGEGFSP